MLTLGRLKQILDPSEPCELDPDKVVSIVTADSREVRPGAVFVALKGQTVDGHSFIQNAIDTGAAVIISAQKIDQALAVPRIRVERIRHYLGVLAAECQGDPSHTLDLIGITGTNGKTTTSFFVRAILNKAGIKTELIGTTGYTLNDTIVHINHTTPEAPVIHKLLAEFRTAGARACILEVSSHAIVFERIAGCRFRGGIFTNITDREHLDFHKTFDHYLEAKKSFFQHYIARETGSFACLNGDDPHLDHFMAASGDRVTVYSRKNFPKASVKAKNIQPGLFGVTFDITIHGKTLQVTIRLTGPYNVENALAAASAAYNLGLEPEQIVQGLESLDSVPGRFELVCEGQEFAVVIDYAHTDDALRNLLAAARACLPNRLITIFGCGGDRDTSKRPRMGKIAAELSDLVFVTSDNPRSENPLHIINQIKTGMPTSADVRTIPDRREAIYTSIATAQKGDMVVIAGKGHEDYQIFADRTIHFNDREEARNALKAINKDACTP